MENFDVDTAMGLFSKLASMGVPGLIAFAVFALAIGAFFIWKSSANFKKQVKQAEIDTATDAAQAQDAIEDADQGGDSFLNS